MMAQTKSKVGIKKTSAWEDAHIHFRHGECGVLNVLSRDRVAH